VLDRKLIAQREPALERQAGRRSNADRNVDRTVGAMLSGEVAKRYGHAGLPDDTIHVTLKGTAGQSFGAWLARGVTLDLDRRRQRLCRQGPVGRHASSSARRRRRIVAEESIIVGNTVLYGATGECYFRGVAASASPCATPARSPSSKARAITAANT
jgi:glutamate synthase (NADPH/NADH) large chain